MATPIFICKLPNDEEGRATVMMIKKHLNKAMYNVRVRGRHPDRVGLSEKHGFYLNSNHDVPLEHAKELAVYCNIKTASDWMLANRENVVNMTEERASNRATINRLHLNVDDLKEKIRDLKSQLGIHTEDTDTEHERIIDLGD